MAKPMLLELLLHPQGLSGFPDAFGPSRKAAYHRDVLKIIAAFGDNNQEEGWKEFDAAIATYHRIISLEDKWLSLGNAIFSDLKVRKDYRYMLDSKGSEHEIYGAYYINYSRAGNLHEFLTNPNWHWFDDVRNTPKYLAAVEWAKTEANHHNSRKHVHMQR